MSFENVSHPISSGELTIASKPSAPISYNFFPSINQPALSEKHLIVIVNGLGLPASSWLPSISLLRLTAKSCPAILTYDRFGQGLTTARDPVDVTKKNGHDFLDVVNDLHEIIEIVVAKYLDLQGVDSGKLQLVLVGASIGAPISRLYTQLHPGVVAGLILLDSNIANVNYSDFWPNPEAPDFDPSAVVSEDCTLEQYKAERIKLTAMFDLNVKNAEGLDRSTSPVLLPYSDSPLLAGPGAVGPLLSVVGHDPETFENLSFLVMKTPKSLSRNLTNPYWARYNEGLTNITSKGRCDGVVIAKGCSHFIQKDSPSFVAEEVERMLKKLAW